MHKNPWQTIEGTSERGWMEELSILLPVPDVQYESFQIFTYNIDQSVL